MIQAADDLVMADNEEQQAELMKWTALFGQRAALLLRLIKLGNPPKVIWEKQIHMVLDSLKRINELLEQEAD